MAQSEKNEVSVEQKIKDRKKPELTWAIVFAVVVFGFLYDVTLGGNIAYYAKWIECGSRPYLVLGSGIGSAEARSYYQGTPFPSPLKNSSTMYCTPLGAEEAGYSSTPVQYQFPHIEQQNKQRTSWWHTVDFRPFVRKGPAGSTTS